MITLNINPGVSNVRAYFKNTKNDKNFLCVCFDLNTEDIRTVLITQGYSKVMDLHESIDYVIEVDSVSTFNSENKQTYSFKKAEEKQLGPITQSCAIPFYNRNLFEDLNFFVRVRITPTAFKATLMLAETKETVIEDMQFQSPKFSQSTSFVVDQDLTLNLSKQMYEIIADENSYNKELYSGVVYRWLIPFAKEADKAKHYLDKVKDQYFIQKIAPESLEEYFGKLYGFPYSISMSYESYRNILMNLYKCLRNTTWDSMIDTVKYLVGYKVEYTKGLDFYPWALKTAELSGEENPSQDVENPSYYNILSNYFVFDDSISEADKCENQAMLLSEDFLTSTTFFNIDNFFNRYIDKEAFIYLVEKLQPANFYSSFQFTDRI